MYFVTVTWIDGREAVYPSVPRWEATDSLLHLHYERESYTIPLANVRSWKTEPQ